MVLVLVLILVLVYCASDADVSVKLWWRVGNRNRGQNHRSLNKKGDRTGDGRRQAASKKRGQARAAGGP